MPADTQVREAILTGDKLTINTGTEVFIVEVSSRKGEFSLGGAGGSNHPAEKDKHQINMLDMSRPPNRFTLWRDMLTLALATGPI